MFQLRGMYIARQLSFSGVTFDITEVKLASSFIEMYDAAVKLVCSIFRPEAALKLLHFYQWWIERWIFVCCSYSWITRESSDYHHTQSKTNNKKSFLEKVLYYNVLSREVQWLVFLSIGLYKCRKRMQQKSKRTKSYKMDEKGTICLQIWKFTLYSTNHGRL